MTLADEVLALEHDCGCKSAEMLPELARRLKDAIEELKAYSHQTICLVSAAHAVPIAELIQRLESPLRGEAE